MNVDGLRTVASVERPERPVTRRPRAATGTEQHAFSRAVTDHHAQLARFAFRLCGDAALAEDVVAEAYAKVWPRWHRGRVDELVPYLRRAVVNEVYGRGRRRRVERQYQARTVEAPASGRFESGVGERDALATAIELLPLRQRVVVVLRIVDDLSEQDTADLLGIPAGTVKSRLSRALDTLRTQLEDDDDA
jgi:RNA polymerase sigma-70 factor (sigma-E family)